MLAVFDCLVVGFCTFSDGSVVSLKSSQNYFPKKIM